MCNKALCALSIHVIDYSLDVERPNESEGSVSPRRVETNPSNKGLISVDRSNKATLLLTIPSFIPVVYKGFPRPSRYL